MDSYNVHYKILPMTRFELVTSGIRSDRFATTTALISYLLDYWTDPVVHLLLPKSSTVAPIKFLIDQSFCLTSVVSYLLSFYLNFFFNLRGRVERLEIHIFSLLVGICNMLKLKGIKCTKLTRVHTQTGRGRK